MSAEDRIRLDLDLDPATAELLAEWLAAGRTADEIVGAMLKLTDADPLLRLEVEQAAAEEEAP